MENSKRNGYFFDKLHIIKIFIRTNLLYCKALYNNYIILVTNYNKPILPDFPIKILCPKKGTYNHTTINHHAEQF